MSQSAYNLVRPNDPSQIVAGSFIDVGAVIHYQLVGKLYFAFYATAVTGGGGTLPIGGDSSTSELSAAVARISSKLGVSFAAQYGTNIFNFIPTNPACAYWNGSTWTFSTVTANGWNILQGAITT